MTKRTFSRIRKAVALLLVLLLPLAATGCVKRAVAKALAEQASGERLPGEGISIGVVIKQSDNAYFHAAVEGFRKASEELGFEFVFDGPDDASNDGQERIIRNYIDQGVDVLCVATNDASGLVDVCNEAREAGILVLSFDSKVNPEGRDLDVMPASFKTIALTQLEFIAEQMNYEGQLALVTGAATMPNMNMINAYVTEAMETDPQYANMEFLGVFYGDDDYTKSYDTCKAIIDQYPDVKGMIAPTTNAGPAVAKCIMDEGKQGQIIMTGLTLAHDMAEYIHSGIAPATFLWNPINLGYATAYVAVAAVNGEIAFREGQTVTIPGYEGLVMERADDGGLILYLNEMNRFDDSTVDQWIDIL